MNVEAELRTAPSHYASARLIQDPPAGWARVRRAIETFGDLLFIQFSTVRTAWHWLFVLSSAMPLGILLFISFVAPHADHSTVLYFITGNVVVALMLNPLFMLSGQLAWARQSKAFDFYASLPISRAALIVAGIFVAVLFTLPGMALLLALGMMVFHLWIVPNPLIILILVLSPTALSGIGASIGVLAPNQNVAGVTANLMLLIVMFLSPIFAPASKLPGVLQVTSRLLPTTYAADGLRQSLSSHLSASFALDLAILALFSVGTIYVVTTRLDWRSR